MSNKGKVAASQAKTTQPPPPAKNTFDAKQWAKNGVS